MKVAAIYDIHGNLPALEAVVADIRRVGVDRIVVGGDVFPGPMACEVLGYLRALTTPVQFISGNGDRVVLEQKAGKESNEVPEPFRDVIRWNAQQLRPEDQQLLAGWPKTIDVEIAGLGPVLFCHATPRNDVEIFTRLTSEERLVPVFHGLNATTVICGHTHMQFDRRLGGIRVVNAGSVGMPFQGPGAYWLLLGPDVQLQQTSYDLANAAERIRATAYPQREDFAERSVLHPPTEAAMLELFAKAELKS
jgi:putative phosphoesterase